MQPCEVCGKSGFENGLAKGRHMKEHKAEQAAADGPVVETVTVPEAKAEKGKPVILKEWRQTTTLKVGLRRIKMLRPICRICEAEDPPRKNWMKDCPHDPYVTLVPGAVVPQRIYGDPLSDGSRPIVRIEQVEGPPTVRPNRVQVALSFGISSGMAVARSVWRKGRIFPEDLGSIVPSRDFPFGIAPACEFNNCWNQVGIREYRQGKFCRDVEAQLVAFHENSSALGALEVGWSADSEARRREQLTGVSIGVAY